jgi:S-DNA-T family DNA segregation ATPase FtsK/SpoIIIE
VILATQRPSTDVITGMIKANFPTRVSFQVASAIDSKVVLNTYGAETLLGRGDMLLVPPGEGNLRRCHGTWISDEEVQALAKHWREQGTPKFEMDILHDPETEASVGGDDAENDVLYDDAVQVVVEAGQASVSFIQRKLGVGYGRAARMIDTMAARGIVGPSRGPNKPREILVNQL